MRIKLPNDIVIAHPSSTPSSSPCGPSQPSLGQKVCGVLTELITAPTGATWCLVGVGINANLGHDDLPSTTGYQATSLLLTTGQPTDLDALRDRLCTHLLCALTADDLTPAMHADLASHLAGLGRWLDITDGPTRLFAQLKGLSGKGELIVQAAPPAGPVVLSPAAQLAWPGA